MESEEFFEGSEPICGSQHVHTDHGKKILALFTLSSRRSKFYREERTGKYFADDFSGNSRDYLAITC